MAQVCRDFSQSCAEPSWRAPALACSTQRVFCCADTPSNPSSPRLKGASGSECNFIWLGLEVCCLLVDAAGAASEVPRANPTCHTRHQCCTINSGSCPEDIPLPKPWRSRLLACGREPSCESGDVAATAAAAAAAPAESLDGVASGVALPHADRIGSRVGAPGGAGLGQ